ncbi:phosphatidylserine/phosphatidylglycerophosphate/cardiolipin synthase family protein [Vibrio sp. 10N.222.51.C12]|uniref:phospholipase D-like domain-containing protein n=1 Tax=unclassified Vibrio TaxID=2614977 RepID=UPI000C8176CB|nr:phospholipase D family protein [Vibrio sp. 10N.286.48.B7]
MNLMSSILQKTNRQLITVLFLFALISGCATHQPQIDSNFESDWQYQTFHGEVSLISSAPQAFAQRLALVRAAQKSIDIEYFSWAKDVSGLMLMDALTQAAKRGVKVRIILDDLLIFNETWLASANQTPNLDLRIFNPFKSRKTNWLGRSFDYQSNKAQLNHRLHEKYFNIDGEVLILGGRNIGDDYFSFKSKNNFFDLDTLIKGQVINPFEENFLALWENDLVTPIEALITSKKQNSDELTQAVAKSVEQNQALVTRIESEVNALDDAIYVPAKITPIFDSVDKVGTSMPYFKKRLEHFVYRYPSKKEELIISTPYLIPHNDGFKVIPDFINHGADVTLFTNSAASNDSPFVPAYYAQHRQGLLDLGVNIYEYDTDATHRNNYHSASGHFHNKAFILDSILSYVGSSNFDPRSDFLNLEFGIVIESEAFAEQLKRYLFSEDHSYYWHVQQDKNDTSWESDTQKITKEPGTTLLSPVSNALFRSLNIESEL